MKTPSSKAQANRRLEEWNLWDGSFQPPGCSPVEYMRELGAFRENPLPPYAPLLAHANYVSDEDIAILAEAKALPEGWRCGTCRSVWRRAKRSELSALWARERRRS